MTYRGKKRGGLICRFPAIDHQPADKADIVTDRLRGDKFAAFRYVILVDTEIVIVILKQDQSSGLSGQVGNGATVMLRIHRSGILCRLTDFRSYEDTEGTGTATYGVQVQFVKQARYMQVYNEAVRVEVIIELELPFGGVAPVVNVRISGIEKHVLALFVNGVVYQAGIAGTVHDRVMGTGRKHAGIQIDAVISFFISVHATGTAVGRVTGYRSVTDTVVYLDTLQIDVIFVAGIQSGKAETLFLRVRLRSGKTGDFLHAGPDYRIVSVYGGIGVAHVVLRGLIVDIVCPGS